jgi:hypothetical protein
MANYPYQASFLGSLPTWPVHYSCELLINETNQGVDILTAFKDLANIAYNDTTDCFDIYEQYIEVFTQIMAIVAFLILIFNFF